MNIDRYHDLLSHARRFVRRAGEAEDLLQESLLVAYEAGRLDLGDDANVGWIVGVMKNRAKMTARSAVRRGRWEQQTAERYEPARQPDAEVDPPDDACRRLLSVLTPASRSVVALVLLGLNRQEICAVLDLTRPALRQRLAAIRRAFDHVPADVKRQALALAYQRKAEHTDALAIGLIRRALIDLVRRREGLGTHDLDGHLFVIKNR